MRALLLSRLAPLFAAAATDLVFIQNGMLQPWLDANGLGENTQVRAQAGRRVCQIRTGAPWQGTSMPQDNRINHLQTGADLSATGCHCSTLLPVSESQVQSLCHLRLLRHKPHALLVPACCAFASRDLGAQ